MTEKPGSVQKDSFARGTASGVDYALELLSPVVLVRYLTPEAFGDYRLVSLLAGTAIVVFPLAVPQSLFYNRSRTTLTERPIFIGNAFLFVLIGKLITGVGLAMAWSWMPPAIRDLERYSLLVPVFLALWVAGSTIEVLPNADGNARWRAMSMVRLSSARVILLTLAAMLRQDAEVLLIAFCAIALVRVLLVPTYAITAASTRRLGIRITLLVRQVRYSFMFALGNMLFMLRHRPDQWVVALFFGSTVFALISIAAVVGSFSTLIGRPLNNATLPHLGLLVWQGRLEEARRLQARTFSALSLTLLPGLGYFSPGPRRWSRSCTPPTYLGAAPLMHIYLVGHIVGIYSAGHLLMTLNAGRLAATISAVGVVIVVTIFTLILREILLSEMHPIIRLTIALASSLLIVMVGATATDSHTKAIELFRGFRPNTNTSG